MSKGDDLTINRIKDLCATIVDIDDVTRDKLKGSTLAVEVRAKALALVELAVLGKRGHDGTISR